MCKDFIFDTIYMYISKQNGGGAIKTTADSPIANHS